MQRRLIITILSVTVGASAEALTVVGASWSVPRSTAAPTVVPARAKVSNASVRRRRNGGCEDNDLPYEVPTGTART